MSKSIVKFFTFVKLTHSTFSYHYSSQHVVSCIYVEIFIFSENFDYALSFNLSIFVTQTLYLCSENFQCRTIAFNLMELPVRTSLVSKRRASGFHRSAKSRPVWRQVYRDSRRSLKLSAARTSVNRKTGLPLPPFFSLPLPAFCNPFPFSFHPSCRAQRTLLRPPPPLVCPSLSFALGRSGGIPLGTFRYSYLLATTSKIPSSPCSAHEFSQL